MHRFGAWVNWIYPSETHKTINTTVRRRNILMKINKWTVGLAAVGLVSLPSVLQAEEKLSPLQTALSSTVISGYVNTAARWNPGTGNANPPHYIYNDPN